MLRVPGTFNRKPSLPPVPVSPLTLPCGSNILRYEPSDFEWLPEVELEAIPWEGGTAAGGDFPSPASADPGRLRVAEALPG